MNEILKLFKELSRMISSHQEPTETKGVHLLEKEERVKMENMKSNYKRESEIEEEMKNVVIENFLDFDVNGKYEFARCEDCNGLLMGHLKVKCPKVEYSDKDVNKFEHYLKRIGGFKEAVWAREKKIEKRMRK